MKYPGLLLLIFILASCKKDNSETITSKRLEVSDNEIVNYVEYCNDRFNFCFDYPSNFGPEPEPANGDGRTFINDIDSSEIVLYGFLDQSNEGIDGQLEVLKEFMEVESVQQIKHGYDVRGIEKESGKVHLEKILMKADSTAGKYDDGKPVNIIYSLQFVYPKDKDAKYRDYWKKMSTKFK